MTGKLLRLVFPLAVVMLHAETHLARGEEPVVFISAFEAGDQGAILAYSVESETGAFKLAHRNAGVEHPFFMALSPNRKFLYSIHAKQFGGPEHEQIAAYEVVGRSGELKLLNRQSAKGTAACYLSVDATGKSVFVSNYTSGSVAALPVQGDGSLGEATSFFQHGGLTADQRKPIGSHAHSIIVSPNNRFVYAADLGIDQIVAYRLEADKAKLVPNKQPFVRTPAGAGPRHITFHPNGKWLYAINETANSITLFDYDADTGMLIERQTIATVPKDFEGKSFTADVKITSDGRFLYGTNRGHHSIAGYRVGADGALTLIGIEPSLGEGPQNLAILPGNKLLLCANMPAKNVAVFRIDPETGSLKSAGTPISTPTPSCIMVLP